MRRGESTCQELSILTLIFAAVFDIADNGGWVTTNQLGGNNWPLRGGKVRWACVLLGPPLLLFHELSIYWHYPSMVRSRILKAAYGQQLLSRAATYLPSYVAPIPPH